MKKKLLSEAQVRRFMGLAGIKPVNEMAYKQDDEEMEEGRRSAMAKRDDMQEDEMEEGRRGPAMKKNEDLMEEEEEMDMDMDADGDADLDIDEEEIEQFKMAADKVAEMAAKLADAAGDEMKDDEPMMDKEEEDDMDKEEEDDMDKELMEIDMELTEEEEKERMEEIVNEVARRVAKRIVEAKRAHKKMNEALGRKK